MIVVIALNLRVMATIVNSVISSCTKSVATSSLNSSSTTHLTLITLSGYKKNAVTYVIYAKGKSRICAIVVVTGATSTWIYTVPSTHHQMLLTILRCIPTSSHLSRNGGPSTVLQNAGRFLHMLQDFLVRKEPIQIYTCKDQRASLHTECVLGDFEGLMPRSVAKLWGESYEVELNNSVTRPFCSRCKSRCMYPIKLKLLGTSGTYACSYFCSSYLISRVGLER